MPKQHFIYQDGQEELNIWQRIGAAWAILGTGRGKFRASQGAFVPLNQKMILMDTTPGSLMRVAMEVPHLNTVISTGAELFSLMEIKHVDENGDEIEDSEVIDFLHNPNPLQSFEQYLYEFYVINAVYNKTFQHMIRGLSFEGIPDAMWLLPSGLMKINTTGKIYRQSDINQIIESYEMYGDDRPFEVNKVIYMAEGIGNSPLNPISRIEALQIPLSNIVAALKSRNIITAERGMIGFIASDSSSSDADGQLPLDAAETKRMREEYQRQYSLDGQGGHVSFTHAKVKWVPMTFDIKQLGLLEGTEDDFAAIIAAYRHDRDLYPSIKGATFENKEAGMRSTIQNGLQPLADKLMRQLKNHFLGKHHKHKLVASYAHLVSMNKDARLAAQGRLYAAQSLEIGLHNGVIDHQQFADCMEWEMNGDRIIKSTAKKPQQNNPADDEEPE